jgi:hypothetical protein
MSGAHEAFKINLNQNLWGSLVGFVGLGTAEHFALCTLFWFSLLLSTVMLISVMATTIAYTMNYWNGKTNRSNQ